MFKFRGYLIPVILFSFVIGAVWGRGFITSSQSDENSVVKILAYRDTVPSVVFKYLEKKHQIKVEIDWVKSIAEWNQKFTKNKYDLIFAYSIQLSELIPKNELEPIGIKDYNFDYISSDFLTSKYGRAEKYSVPIGWSVMGFLYSAGKVKNEISSWEDVKSFSYEQKIALTSGLHEIYFSSFRSSKKNKQTPAYVSTDPLKDVIAGQAWMTFISRNAFLNLEDKGDLEFRLPKNKIPFWILSASIVKGSVKKELAFRVMRTMSKPAVAKLFVKKGKLSSTFKSVEDLPVPPELKPSYFRKLPLKKVFFADSSWLY